MLQLHLLIEASGNMFIAIVCISVCDIINFEICFSFLVKPFSCIIKKIRIKMQMYLKKERVFQMK